MRCPECGHQLVGVPEDVPCSECGMTSAIAARDPGPLPSPGALALRYGWPSFAGAALLAFSALALDSAVDGAVFFAILAAGILMLLVGPLNSGLQTWKLMKRMPRRTREAPMLALIPRVVLVPLLAAIATLPVNVALAFGACVVPLAFGRVGAGP